MIQPKNLVIELLIQPSRYCFLPQWLNNQHTGSEASPYKLPAPNLFTWLSIIISRWNVERTSAWLMTEACCSSARLLNCTVAARRRLQELSCWLNHSISWFRAALGAAQNLFWKDLQYVTPVCSIALPCQGGNFAEIYYSFITRLASIWT